MAINYAQAVATPQTVAADPRQVKNAAGGFVFAADIGAQLRRFLILGTEGGTYYASEQKMSVANAGVARKALAEMGVAAVDMVVVVACEGLAPRRQPALFVLALALAEGAPAVKAAAEAAFREVVRTGYDYLYFVGQVDQMRGWGRSLKRVLAGWFNKSDDDLVYQAMKYRQREGWAMRDVLRKIRVRPLHPMQDAVFSWLAKESAAKLEKAAEGGCAPALRLLQAHHLIKTPGFTEAQAAEAIRRFNLPREVVPTELLKSRAVWDALLEKAPPVMTLRNLGRLQVLYGERSDALYDMVRARLTEVTITAGRVHPMAVYLALTTYRAGKGERGKLSWSPDTRVVALLEDAFEWAIPGMEEVAGKHVVAVDCSGSMTAGVLGSERISATEAAAAMAYAVFKRAPDTTRVLKFGTGVGEVMVHRRTGLREFVGAVRADMGGTDCAQPILWALQNQPDTGLLTILTDNETWAGKVHAHELRKAAPTLRIANVAMSAVPGRLCDPADLLALDCVGFDPTLGSVLARFSREGK